MWVGNSSAWPPEDISILTSWAIVQLSSVIIMSYKLKK